MYITEVKSGFNIGWKSDSLSWMQHYCTHRFLMIGQRGSRLPGNEIPEPDGGVMASCGIDIVMVMTGHGWVVCGDKT